MSIEIKKSIMWSHAKHVGKCMFGNTLITVGMVAVALGFTYIGFVVKNKKYKPLMYFSALALSGDLVSGYCINCRSEIQEFKDAKEAYEQSIKNEKKI